MNYLDEILIKDESQINMMSPLTWAYVGDSVYELYIRVYLANTTNLNPHKMHVESIKYVKAGAQSEAVKKLIETDFLTDDEKELLNNVFEFNDIVVSEIMTHRTDIFAIDQNMNLTELLEEISSEDYRYSRIPVYDETIDEIQGIIYIKDVLKNINKKTLKIKNIMIF